MGGDVETIKGRLDIAQVVSGYIKIEKAGRSFKARCPFHNEKTPSFFISPERQSFYCFGCGAKGDIFSFVEQMEGLDFREALKLLAEKAGVELQYRSPESKMEKDELFGALEEATGFFEKELSKNKEAYRYILSRGIGEQTIKDWRIGYAPFEWRSLYNHVKERGLSEPLALKAGLIKKSAEEEKSKEPYDIFRDRIIFPLFDASGRVIAFSGRALSKETEPKYLNSPDTVLFTKSEVLYGLDRAKQQIRQKDYTVLVEGQIDLVLSHQAGVGNTVASSGTAFTQAHLERLKNLSSRIILAFDGDSAGQKAAEKASILGISLGLEVKVASLPDGLDPAEVVKKNPEDWKNILRASLPTVEFFLNKVEAEEKDPRKLGKLIEKNILPMIKLLGSAIERSHFISMIAKRTGIKEEILWEDLKRIKTINLESSPALPSQSKPSSPKSQKEQIEERLSEIKLWQEELKESKDESLELEKEEIELLDNLSGVSLHESLQRLLSDLAQAEKARDTKAIQSLAMDIKKIHSDIRSLEEKKKRL